MKQHLFCVKRFKKICAGMVIPTYYNYHLGENQASGNTHWLDP